MSKTAWIFPGQGAQKCGMGKDFFEHSSRVREIYGQASELLDLDMEKICFEKNELLDETEYTQAAMVTTCCAMAEVLKERGFQPDVTAGLSLGEYCAIFAAGGIRLQDAVTIARKRGIFMQNAAPDKKGAMAAVLGLNETVIEETIAEIQGVGIANYNCPGQVVITGYEDAVETAAAALKEAGVKRVARLNVSGAFHSPLLKEAGECLKKELDRINLMPLKVPYVTNVTAEYVRDIQETKALLARQVSAPVRWQQSMEMLIADGVDTFVEIGPGNTLSGFMKRISRDVKMHHISTWEELESFCHLNR